MAMVVTKITENERAPAGIASEESGLSGQAARRKKTARLQSHQEKTDY